MDGTWYSGTTEGKGIGEVVASGYPYCLPDLIIVTWHPHPHTHALTHTHTHTHTDTHTHARTHTRTHTEIWIGAGLSQTVPHD